MEEEGSWRSEDGGVDFRSSTLPLDEEQEEDCGGGGSHECL